jgi:hypothetical protein
VILQCFVDLLLFTRTSSVVIVTSRWGEAVVGGNTDSVVSSYKPCSTQHPPRLRGEPGSQVHDRDLFDVECPGLSMAMRGMAESSWLLST